MSRSEQITKLLKNLSTTTPDIEPRPSSTTMA